MQRNSVRWLAMFLSVVAGIFASEFASTYTDGNADVAVSSSPSDPSYAATVAFGRDVTSYDQSAQN